MTITDLDTYRHNVNVDPADLLQVIATRRIWAWIADDLRKRRKKLQQAAGDPKTRSAKREKRLKELEGLEATLTAINNAKFIKNEEENSQPPTPLG